MKHYNIELGISFERNELRDSLQGLLYNITANQFVVGVELDALGAVPCLDILNQSYEAIDSGACVEWFLSRENFLMKITMQGRLEGGVVLTPIKPFKLKCGGGDVNESIDLGFYIQCCIELSENFAVESFRTE